MCRNIHRLHNVAPPVSPAEIEAAALQFVRKVGGGAPSRANTQAYAVAVTEISATVTRLLDTLVTSAPPRDRESDAAKARARSAVRYGANA